MSIDEGFSIKVSNQFSGPVTARSLLLLVKEGRDFVFMMPSEYALTPSVDERLEIVADKTFHMGLV